jgi:hypothetical protein
VVAVNLSIVPVPTPVLLLAAAPQEQAKALPPAVFTCDVKPSIS